MASSDLPFLVLPCTALVWIVTLAFLLLLWLLLRSSSLPSGTPYRILSEAPTQAVVPLLEPSKKYEISPVSPRPESSYSPDRGVMATVTDRMFLESLSVEVCSKAKDAGRHPSYVPLCLSLVHHYGLHANAPVIIHGLTIFHCCCLSGSLELVSSLAPLADLTQMTERGESALYLAVQGHSSQIQW